MSERATVHPKIRRAKARATFEGFGYSTITSEALASVFVELSGDTSEEREAILRAMGRIARKED